MKTPKEKRKVIKNLKKDGFSLDNGFRKIGFIFDNLESSQAVYTMIHNSNQYLSKNNGTNISLFVKSISHVCISPNFAIFNLSRIRDFDGILIATSMDTAKELSNAVRTKDHGYYVYDIEWTRPKLNINQDEAASILGNEKIIKFTRATDYLPFLKDYNNVSNTIVEDFNIDTIYSIFKGKDNE